MSKLLFDINSLSFSYLLSCVDVGLMFDQAFCRINIPFATNHVNILKSQDDQNMIFERNIDTKNSTKHPFKIGFIRPREVQGYFLDLITYIVSNISFMKLCFKGQ